MKIDLLLDSLKNIKSSRLDDFADRLNYIWTSLAFVFFTLCIGLQQTFKQALHCKQPANFPGTWVNYVDNYCYINGTYHDSIKPYVKPEIPKFNLGYYQWVPYILAAQALSFYLPHWIYLCGSHLISRVNVKSVVDNCHDVSIKKREEFEDGITEIGKTVYDYSTLPHEVRAGGEPKPMGNAWAYFYLFCKLLNIVNILGNIALFAYSVGKGDFSWAFNVVQGAYYGDFVNQSKYFPRVTFCEVEFKTHGQSQTRKIQCLMMINILAEKVFVFMHFWLLLVLVWTLLNFFHSVYEVLLKSDKRAAVLSKPFFDNSDDDGFSTKYSGLSKHQSFWQNYLGLNGNLLIRFVEDHAGVVAASKLLEALVREWKRKGEHDSNSSGDGPDKENNANEAREKTLDDVLVVQHV